MVTNLSAGNDRCLEYCRSNRDTNLRYDHDVAFTEYIS